MLLYQIVVVAEVALVAVADAEVALDLDQVLVDAVGVLVDPVGVLADPVWVSENSEPADSEYTARVHSSLYLVELYRHKHHWLLVDFDRTGYFGCRTGYMPDTGTDHPFVAAHMVHIRFDIADYSCLDNMDIASHRVAMIPLRVELMR